MLLGVFTLKTSPVYGHDVESTDVLSWMVFFFCVKILNQRIPWLKV